MNIQNAIIGSLIRALAYRATSRAPWWLALLILAALFLFTLAR